MLHGYCTQLLRSGRHYIMGEMPKNSFPHSYITVGGQGVVEEPFHAERTWSRLEFRISVLISFSLASLTGKEKAG